MKFRFKIVSIIIAFILIVGLLLVFSDLKNSNEKVETGPEQQQKETTLFWSEADFNEIHLINESENSEIILVKNEQGNWDTAELFEEEINLNKLDQTVSIIFSLSSNSKEVRQSAEDVFTEEMERSITLVNQSGIKEKLTIGKGNKDGTFYYASLLDSEEIYQVSAELIDALPSHPEDLFDRSIVQITSGKVNRININNGIQTIEIAPIAPYSEEEAKTNLSGWYMLGPYHNAYPIKYNLMSEMIYGIKNIEWVKMIEESEIDLETYGLNDVNFEITFSSDSEEETILIGAPATNQSHYVKLADANKVFIIDNKALHPFSYEAFDLVEKYVKKIDLDVLKKLEIQTENEHIHMTVEQNNSSEENPEENLIYKINGYQIEGNSFKDLYMEIADLSVSGEVDSEVYHIPQITMIYTILDSVAGEKEITIDFVDYDEENYAIFLDKKVDFIIKKENVSQMIENINKLLK